MKHLNLIAALLLITSTTFAQSYFLTTAKKTGNWSEESTWNISVRTDGKKVNTVVIPTNITVYVNDDNNMVGYGDMEIEVTGKLQMIHNSSLSLTKGSKITVKDAGVIDLDTKAMNDKKNDKIKYSEQIIIGGVVKFDGAKEDDVKGNVFASQITAGSPFGFSSNAMLPVNFVSFTVKNAKEGVNAINWTTADEVNNSHFEIERSVDGTNWSSIATMFPEEGSGLHAYRYNDKFSAKGAVYYRIRQIDRDGKDKYSSVRMINGVKSELESLIYVSAKNTVTIDLRKSVENNIIVRVISMNGVVVSQKNSNLSGEKITLTAYNAAPGAYVVQVSDMNGLFTSKKVLL
jgi:hypothetical protein